MTITFSTIPLNSEIHGTPRVPPWTFQRVTQTFFGVPGEVQLLGAAESREIVISYTMTGHATQLNLQAGIAQFALALGLTGDLEINLGGGDVTEFVDCTFDGFFPEEDPWYDGSGVNGWQCRGTLRFRQKAGTT